MFVDLNVMEFNEDSLKKAITEGDQFKVVDRKRHFNYLYGYLNEMGCKSIVMEAPYVDGDYLDDYSAYYVKCFKIYKRKCKRLHFFKINITQDELIRYLTTDILTALTKEQLQENYLGFSVIKPLPEAFIGKTALKTYPTGVRNFPCIRKYLIGFLGTKLEIESLAFQ
jgi:hypothetical protein